MNFTQDILRPYLRDTSRWKKPSTVRTEAANAAALERLFGVCSMSSITGQRVAEYREQRKREGVSPDAIRRELVVASAACQYAIRERNVDITNPFLGRAITREDARTVRPRRRVVEASEERALLIASPQPLRDMILLWLETGLRVTELRLLRHDQVDLTRRTIEFRPEQHKSGTWDAAALTERAVALISGQPLADGCPYVFQRCGRALTQSEVSRMFQQARVTAGCPDVQLRDLRRTSLQRWRDRYGVEVAQAQARHRDIRTTERVYARPSIEVVLEAMRQG